MARTRTHFAWDSAAPTRQFRTGVSLHSHTAHSLETLAIVDSYAEHRGGLARLLESLKRQCLPAAGDGIDFSRLYFTPPLAPLEAFEVERRQIEDRLGLEALVSLTDHDTFEGCAVLRRIYRRPEAPYSIEWTLPFGPTYLHLGIHNVPEAHAPSVGRELARLASGCSFCRDDDVSCYGAHKRLTDGPALGGCGLRASGRPAANVLGRLASFPDVLVVLNHPMWDMNGLGDREHGAVVGRFLGLYGEFVHALEVNGLRPWAENASTVRAASSFGLPVVAGGDRHGCEPAAVVNLTNAKSLAEFVEEIRYGRHSDVLYLPQYREPLLARKVQAICDVVRDDPDHAYGMRRWTDRVLLRDAAGRMRSLSELWPEGDPMSVRASRLALQSLGRWPLSSAMRLALARGAEVAA